MSHELSLIVWQLWPIVRGRTMILNTKIFDQNFLQLDHGVRNDLFDEEKIKLARWSRPEWTGMPKNVKNFDFGIDSIDQYLLHVKFFNSQILQHFFLIFDLFPPPPPN